MGAFDAKLDEVVEAEKLSELERKQRTLFSDGQQSYRPMSSSEKMKIHPRNAEPVRASPVDMQVSVTYGLKIKMNEFSGSIFHVQN